VRVARLVENYNFAPLFHAAASTCIKELPQKVSE